MEKIKYDVLDDIPVLKEGKKYFYFYKIVNEQNNKFYYGVHSTRNLNDGYQGSSKALKRDIKMSGVRFFKKYILKFFDDEEKMYDYESKIVTKDMVLKKDCYNMHTGGSGSWDFTLGKVCVKDASGNTMMVDKDDESYLSGELVSNMTGLIHVRSKTGESLTITKDEYYNNKNLYLPLINDYVLAKNKTGETKWIRKDEFYELKKNGEAVGHTKNKGVFKDKNGKNIMCDLNDERVLNGELVGATKGKYVYKFKNDFNNFVVTTKDDERVKNGELVGLNYGMVQCINPVTKERITVPKGDERLKTGELITYTKFLYLTGKLNGNNRKPMSLNDFKEKYNEIFQYIDEGKTYKDISEKTGLKTKKIQYIVSRYNLIKKRELQEDCTGGD